MKTIKEWLEELPEPIREKAKQNLNQNNSEIMVDSLQQAISNAFIWDDTDEGYRFWSYVYEEPQTFIKDQLLSKLSTFNPKKHSSRQIIDDLTKWAKEIK